MAKDSLFQSAGSCGSSNWRFLRCLGALGLLVCAVILSANRAIGAGGISDNGYYEFGTSTALSQFNGTPFTCKAPECLELSSTSDSVNTSDYAAIRSVYI
jgi:hypothetical protein